MFRVSGCGFRARTRNSKLVSRNFYDEETKAEPTITLNVTRYRPGQDRAPTTQAYTVPYKQDWVVLDALNHIKDLMLDHPRLVTDRDDDVAFG